MDHVLARSVQVVLIEDEHGFGTGFFVGPDGLILTNRHVAPSAGPFRVVLASGRNLRGIGLHQSLHHDLAVVSVATDSPAHFDLDRDATDDYGVGTEVWALGHPRGCRNSVARGIVSNPHQTVDRDVFVQTDAGVNPGNSGGPLLDGAGRLVGVVSAMLPNSQGLGFAVPSYAAADYVRNVRRMLRRGVVRPARDLLPPDGEGGTVDERIHGGIDTFVVRGLGVVREDATRPADVTIRTDAGPLRAQWTDGALTVSCAIGGVGPAEAANASLLRRALEANGSGELRSAALGLRDGALHVVARRSTALLDPTEVFFTLDQVRAAALAWGPRWSALCYEAQGPMAPMATASPVEVAPVPSEWNQPLRLPDLSFRRR
ncbi:trypsin-like peptidase domain-containing protein [Sorangium sp. So ce260]|uniref:S1C family serine protease n=1 Tax=Sorangium sp. So ce260 TaxID=3133291 RepID=UPI003F624A95